ncbi:MAG: hypothetical protein GWN00_12190, partial [Aliifodinibius sp.]|nr:hypothetical protein [Fodinibius sp.]NIY25540.1 hypothetical protein [Fodinibius sp.]
MYEIYEKEGLLDSGVVHTSVFDESDYDSLHLSAKEITDIINKASRGWYPNKIKFYLKPRNFYRYVLPKIRSFDDLMYG